MILFCLLRIPNIRDIFIRRTYSDDDDVVFGAAALVVVQRYLVFRRCVMILFTRTYYLYYSLAIERDYAKFTFYFRRAIFSAYIRVHLQHQWNRIGDVTLMTNFDVMRLDGR